jgi:membrane protease YdiL (CAAX protease family)
MSLLMLAPNLAGQFCLVLVALAVAFIVRFWERRPLAILGLRRPHASSFAWAATLAVAYVFVATPLTYSALSFLGWRSFEPTVQLLAVFAYAHAPLWGIGASTALLIPALFSALFYLWRRDLSANVLAHIAVDLVGIVINAPS